jgi:chemotaxis protein methyltransferase CheR
MQADPDFLEIVAKRITVNTTELFRDPKMWIDLKRFFLPGLSEKKEINIWHSGCSTGQEVYSMMILLDVMGLLDRSHILATDINSDVLETAEKGTYKYLYNIEYLANFNKVINDGKEKADFIPFRKYCHVDPVKDTFQMKSFLFQKPRFNKFDLVNDNHKKEEFDLIICRNVIIYFNNELQERAIRLFHEALKPSGILMLGRHESIVGPASLLFEKKQHLYFKK